MQCYYGMVSEPYIDKKGHQYCGLCRQFDTYVAATQEDHPAWSEMLKYWSTDYGLDEEWDGYFPTIDEAKSLQARFIKIGYSFGIIAIYPCGSAEEVEETKKFPRFLGLDVSNTEPNSVLSPGVIWRGNWSYEDTLDVFWDMISKYARLCINQYGLLTNYEDAVLLRDYSHALEIIDKTNRTIRDVKILAIREILE